MKGKKLMAKIEKAIEVLKEMEDAPAPGSGADFDTTAKWSRMREKARHMKEALWWALYADEVVDIQQVLERQ